MHSGDDKTTQGASTYRDCTWRAHRDCTGVHTCIIQTACKALSSNQPHPRTSSLSTSLRACSSAVWGTMWACPSEAAAEGGRRMLPGKGRGFSSRSWLSLFKVPVLLMLAPNMSPLTLSDWSGLKWIHSRRSIHIYILFMCDAKQICFNGGLVLFLWRHLWQSWQVTPLV